MAKVGAKESKEKKWKDKEKKKREKQINDYKNKVEEHNQRWPHLPNQVAIAFYHFKRRSSFYVQESGVSKVWRGATRGCSSAPQSPWLVLAHQEINTTREAIITYKSPYCAFNLIFDDSELGFTLYPWGRERTEYSWIVQQGCTIVGPNSFSDEQFRFTNAIACGGKFYALSLQGTLAVIDLEGPPAPELRAIMSIPAGVKRAIPSTCSSKGFREYLVELDGEVVLVLFVSTRSMNVVDDVEVFRLDLTIKVGWVKIGSLGDRTMFVGRKYASHFSASQLFRFEYAKNCIYFNLEIGAGWWVFDVGSRRISPVQM